MSTASTPMRGTATATTLLVATTAVWGSTFVLLRGMLTTWPPVDLLAVRFVVATCCMAVVMHRQVRALSRRDLLAGVGVGAVYAAAQVLQTVGLVTTPAARSGFLTGLYVVITPLVAALVWRDRITRAAAVAVVLALAGCAVLTAHGDAAQGFGVGDALTVAGAAFFALHIVALGHVSRADNSAGLAVVQVATCAVVTVVAAAPGGITMPRDPVAWVGLLYLALVAGAGALWAQTWAQTRLPATRAAIIMTCEPLFAAGFSVLVGAEPLTARLAVGGVLVLAAMYVVELDHR